MQLWCRVVVASTGKRSAQDLTGVDGDVVALEGNGWVVVRTSDGSETLRVQQRYLEKRPKDHSEVAIRTMHLVQGSAYEQAPGATCGPWDFQRKPENVLIFLRVAVLCSTIHPWCAFSICQCAGRGLGG